MRRALACGRKRERRREAGQASSRPGTAKGRDTGAACRADYESLTGAAACVTLRACHCHQSRRPRSALNFSTASNAIFSCSAADVSVGSSEAYASPPASGPASFESMISGGVHAPHKRLITPDLRCRRGATYRGPAPSLPLLPRSPSPRLRRAGGTGLPATAATNTK